MTSKKKTVTERKHNFVVGYEGEGQCIYDCTGSIDPMTFHRAKREAKDLTCLNGGKTVRGIIYKLVPMTIESLFVE